MTDAPDAARAGAGRLIILLVGAGGAGKGTQAAALSSDLGLPHLASGNLFRSAMEDGTPLGEEARGFIERGELVPDEITIRMFLEELSKPDAAGGGILDGFPRTLGQARALDEWLAARGERVRRVFFIEVPTEELVRRLAGRWVCPECGTPYHEQTDPPRVAGLCDNDGTPLRQREDDRPDVVRARLSRQVPPMREVVEHYERAGALERIDGTQDIEKVTADILGRVAAARQASA